MPINLLCAVLQLALAVPDTYPRNDLLIEPAELAKPATAKSFLVLDARAKEKYDAGHIPGAVWVDHEVWSTHFPPIVNHKQWAEILGDAGISNTSKIVVYDDAMSKNAARIWWIVRYHGVQDVRILNGGWKGWTEGSYAVSKERTQPAPATFRLDAISTQRLATKDRVLDMIKGNKTQIIDARSEKENCGDELLTNKRGGAMPGAINLEWSDALDKTTQRFKTPAELKKILADAGIDVTKPTVTYCQSGGRASVMAFTIELMGGTEVSNYYRSWAEWGNSDDTPIVTPARKK